MPKVLIVEDDHELRGILKDTLEMHNYAVIEARDGQEGLEMAATSKPDLIISDALMQGIDGFQFLREIKKNRALKSIPFIVHSGVYTGQKEVELALSLGADALITKPKTPLEFWKELSGILEERKIKQEKPAVQIEKEEDYLREYSNIVTAKLEEKIEELKMDIVERKRTEEALYQSEKRYRKLAENARDVIFTLSADGTIASLNPVFEIITGLSRAEWIGKNFAQIIHPDDLPFAMERFEDVLRGETPLLFELRTLSKSGEYLVGEFMATPNIENGKVIGMLGIARDVTERKRADEEQKKRVKELEEFYNMAIGRELRMKELKEEIEMLKEELRKYRPESQANK